MREMILTSQSVLEGYDAVCELYAYVPPMSHWRAWEFGAYAHFSLSGRVLDVGCGDGRYFSLVWPNVDDVTGVERDEGVADAGVRSGVYKAVHVANAHEIPEPDESFDHAFANCSLEHMDQLDEVLAEILRCIKPGGTLLCSVVTDRFLHWNLLPNLLQSAGHQDASQSMVRQFLDFHNLVNPLSVDDWRRRFESAGFAPEVHVPILPQWNCGMFLLMDCLWHVRRQGGGELGDIIHASLSGNSNFPGGFRTMLAGLMEMESDWRNCGGAVFQVRKPLRVIE
ncbi:class I SAM-dependent methyltransferase [Lysobacter sp. TAF61]|uniref:class I SAM-dependent methyltransferase n=1 Tax=Lysobacter sp. TAF61 TaxID=3233072 RepID=UPI003F9E3DBA